MAIFSAKVKKTGKNVTEVVSRVGEGQENGQKFDRRCHSVPGLIFSYRLGTLFFIMPRLLLQVCMVFSDLEQIAVDLERNSPLKREMRERDR